MDIKDIIKAKEKRIAKLRLKHRSETASGFVWNDDAARKEAGELQKEADRLNLQLAKMA